MKIIIIFIIALCFNASAFAAEGNGLCVSCHDIRHYQDKGTCVSCHSGNAKTKRNDIAHYRIIKGKYAVWRTDNATVAESGEKLIELARCRRCHTVGGKGENFASNLDSSIGRLVPDEVAKAISEPADNMPDFGFEPDKIDNLVNSLYNYSSIYSGGSMIQTVHFGGLDTAGLFEKKCGGCHMTLSKRGSLGKKTLAPNLSGLGGEYYYFIDGQRWSKKLLADWLKNPRSVSAMSVMPVIELTESEQEEIVNIFF